MISKKKLAVRGVGKRMMWKKRCERCSADLKFAHSIRKKHPKSITAKQ
jgi:hypothetical protein